MLQLIVYGAWCNKGINEKRPGFDSYELTLRDVFQMAGIIDFLGYMKEYHRVKLELAWGIIHRRFIHPPKASFSSLEFADSGNVCKRPFRHWQNDRPEIT